MGAVIFYGFDEDGVVVVGVEESCLDLAVGECEFADEEVGAGFIAVEDLESLGVGFAEEEVEAVIGVGTGFGIGVCGGNGGCSLD